MDTEQHILYVTSLLEKAVLDSNWEAASRFVFVLYLLDKDLILEQKKLIRELRRSG